VKMLRAGNFRMLRGFSRVGGVLIGEGPDNPKTVLAYKDLQWSIRGRDVTLVMIHQSGTTQSFGPFDRSLVHQALAYTADGRPVAVTMTEAKPVRPLKIHLHPALLDTPVGCRVTELDRFVDTFTRQGLPEREGLTKHYQTQLMAYNLAWAVRIGRLDLNERYNDLAKAMLSSAALNEALNGALKQGILKQGDLFQAKPEYFDSSLVKSIRACAVMPEAETFVHCVRKDASSSLPKDEAGQRRLLVRPEFIPWSGVRERKFRLSDDLSFLRPPTGKQLNDRLWPLDFMIQVAFTSPPLEVPEGISPGEYQDENPLEFQQIQPKIAALVWAGIQQRQLEPMFRELRDFTVLQRLFRVALSGNLGPNFPTERLGALTRATAGGIPYLHTPRWNGSQTSRLEQALAVLRTQVTGAEPWVPAARAAVARCHIALRQNPARIAEDCKISSALSPALARCEAKPGDWSCAWAGLVQEQIPDVYRIENAFGVLQDEQKSQRGNLPPGMCPPLAPTLSTLLVKNSIATTQGAPR